MVAGKGHQTSGGARRIRRRARKGDVTLITSARRSPLQDWHKRRRTYAILQFARLPLLAASGLLMWLTNNIWLSASVAIFSLPLPWVAVLLANEKGDGDPREHNVYKPQLVREQRAAEALEAKRRQQLEQERARELTAGSSCTQPEHNPPQIIDMD